MADRDQLFQLAPHDHVFLAQDHEAAERRTWAVIGLCGVMMVAEIIGGALFGSLALIADGLHMSTHAGALLLAALAYTYARKYVHDSSFTFGTGKFGDLAGYTSAIVLAMIALLIGYEAINRLLHPVAIAFDEAIPIAALGLMVNIASAWLLSGGPHRHGHSHGQRHGHDHEEPREVAFGARTLKIEVFEGNRPPRFRLTAPNGALPAASDFTIETIRPNGSRQLFAFTDHGGYLESRDEIPEPHAFLARISLRQAAQVQLRELQFEEHDHDATHRDNNMRAALIHVLADAAVSVLVIAGLILARAFNWLWMDPLAGFIGALVIANWSVGLVRDTGAILLDRLPDSGIAEKVRQAVEGEGDRITDLHLWRLGPGHLGAIVSVATSNAREASHYRRRLEQFSDLSHVTVEVQHSPSSGGMSAS
ncbi:MAG: CDF family Co(II)/Ni(II) efflux transporter DmeF [Bradyrhizobium sp.]|nr:CDF family Co(II)/Ni(II) efflux transporter DmeF [Bradyrhizobium sp.]